MIIVIVIIISATHQLCSSVESGWSSVSSGSLQSARGSRLSARPSGPCSAVPAAPTQQMSVCTVSWQPAQVADAQVGWHRQLGTDG